MTVKQQIKLREFMKLVKKTEITKPDIVYNLHVKNDHNYIVQGAVVSNCHGAKASALKDLHTGVLSTVPIRWGLTGTVPKEKMDAITLKICFGNVINYLPASELQEQGVLAKCHVNIVQLQDNVVYKDYQSELKHLLENEERLNVIGNIINKLKVTGNTLVLVDRIAAGKELESRIPDSVFVSGATKVTTRQDEYDKIAVNSGLVLLATYQVAAVGINLPRIFNVVLIEPGKSFVRTIQSIGRGLRMAPDKDHVEIYDITSNCKFSKRHLTQRKTFYDEAKYDFTMEKLSYRTK